VTRWRLRLRDERRSRSFDQIPIFADDIKGKVAALDFFVMLKNRPTRLGATLMNRNFRGVHLMRAETVAACFLEVSTPSKNLAQGKLRTHLWRRLRATPFRKLIYSESPSCA
jgi:hypothetical protein